MKISREHDDFRWYVDHETGKRYISVTSVLDVAMPKYLQKWMTNTSPKQIEKKRKESTDHGTQIHSYVESSLKGSPVEVDPEHLKHMEQWEGLKTKHDITAVHTEITLVSDKYGFAGTADIIGGFEGKPSVMDLKTGKSYNIKTGWQLAAYKIAAEEMGLGKNLGMACLQIPSDGRPAKAFKYEHYDFCFNRFLDCLGVFKGLYFSRLKAMDWPWLNDETRDEK